MRLAGTSGGANVEARALVSWNKMCLAKDDGGIGMRNLSAFNDALLAKQAWRLVSNSNSFDASILKGKYFHRTSFWDANTPPDASYTWKSIMSARELLLHESRWIIGDGRSVRFWKDKWVPGLPGGRILSQPPTSYMEDNLVHE